MEETIEYQTMRNKRPELSIGLQRDMVSLATSLNNQGLIDDQCYDKVTQSGSSRTDTQKADEMVHMLVNSVKFSKDNFHRILKIFSANRFQKSLVDILSKEYMQLGK